MKHLTYTKKGTLFVPIKYWKTDKNTEVAIYQGERGANPELDFIVKYKETGKRLRMPSHTHWIVDILIKSEFNKKVVSNYINNMLEVYDNTVPFNTQAERLIYELRYPDSISKKFAEIDSKGYFSLNTLTTFIELFSLCEKQTPNAFMFRGLLRLIKEYTEGQKDFYQIVGLSKRV